MREYLESHYPARGETSYEIGFDWGSYDIYTTAPALRSDGDDARSGGYVVARPRVRHGNPDMEYWTYLVTPGGKVWRRLDHGGTRVRGHRKRVRQKGDGKLATSSKNSPESPAEAIINDFLRRPEQWSRYGMLVPDGKDGYRLERVATPLGHKPRRRRT